MYIFNIKLNKILLLKMKVEMTESTIINLGEEKSVFERAVIEAYKQKTSKVNVEPNS
jgi:hypothetical protein